MKRVSKEAVPQESFTDIGALFKDTDSELAAFVGQSMIMTPGDLIFDPNIIDGSVRYWCALRSYFPQAGEVHKPPTQEEMSLRLGINRKTAGTYFNILRATRWITVLKVIKQNNLEIGFSYLLHDTRMELDIVLKHDATYVDFLMDNTKAKNKKLRDFCYSSIVYLPNHAMKYLNQRQVERRKTLLSVSITPDAQTLPNGGNSDAQNLPSGGNSDVQILPSGGNPDVQILPSGGNSDVQILPSGGNSDVQILPSGGNSDAQILPSGGNPDVQILPSGGNSDVQILPSGGNSDAQILPSGGNPDAQNFPDEDKYNTARMHAPTRSSISVGDNITTTTSGDGGGSGGDNFDFLQTSPLLSEILTEMTRDELHFGESAVSAIKSCLLQKNHVSKDGKAFTWVCTEGKAAEMLIVLLAEKPDRTLPFLKTLLFSDSLGEFLLKAKQRKLLNEYRKRLDPDFRVQQQANKRHETPLDKFTRWLNSSDEAREFTPLPLREGQEIKILKDLTPLGVKAESVTVLTLPAWITDLSVRQQLIATGVRINEDSIDRVTNLSLCFSEDKKLDYEAVCKGIELGLLAVKEWSC